MATTAPKTAPEGTPVTKVTTSTLERRLAAITDAGGPNPYANLPIQIWKVPRGKTHVTDSCTHGTTAAQPAQLPLTDLTIDLCSKCQRRSIQLPADANDYLTQVSKITTSVSLARRRLPALTTAVARGNTETALREIDGWARIGSDARNRIGQLVETTDRADVAAYCHWAAGECDVAIPHDTIDTIRNLTVDRAIIAGVTINAGLDAAMHDLGTTAVLDLPPELAEQWNDLFGHQTRERGTFARWAIRAACGDDEARESVPFDPAIAIGWNGPYTTDPVNYPTPKAWLEAEWTRERDRLVNEIVAHVRSQLQEPHDGHFLVGKRTAGPDPSRTKQANGREAANVAKLWPTATDREHTAALVPQPIATLLGRNGWATTEASPALTNDTDLAVTLSFTAANLAAGHNLDDAATLAETLI